MKDEFILTCKAYYFEGITPQDTNKLSVLKRQKLISIGKTEFFEVGYERFAQYLMEGQYYINLWASHIILESGLQNEQIKALALSKIKKYAQSSFSKKVMLEEQQWLDENLMSFEDK